MFSFTIVSLQDIIGAPWMLSVLLLDFHTCAILLELGCHLSGVFVWISHVCHFTGTGVFSRLLVLTLVLGCPLESLLDFQMCVLSLVPRCPRRLPLAFVTRQMEPVLERDPIQEHQVLSTGRKRVQMFPGENPGKQPIRKSTVFWKHLKIWNA